MPASEAGDPGQSEPQSSQVEQSRSKGAGVCDDPLREIGHMVCSHVERGRDRTVS
jgi:hypothetical protein